jgi:hypothetical protein
VPKRLLIEDPKKKSMSHKENKNKGTHNARLDFSATNNGKMTCDWMDAIRKKDGIVPKIYDRVLKAAGYAAKQSDDDMPHISVNDCADVESETDESEDGENE